VDIDGAHGSRARLFWCDEPPRPLKERSGQRMAQGTAKAKTADAVDAEGGPKKAGLLGKFSLKTIIMAVGGLVVVGGGGFGAMKLLHHEEEKKPVVAEAKPAVFFDVPDVLVNLSNGNGERTQYLKVKAVLEVPDQALVAQITPVMPRVLDTFQTYLRELRPSDLDGSAGLYRLKEELMRRVNTAIAPNKITAVLFKEIVVQ
jgi:flagellar FliL protein